MVNVISTPLASMTGALCRCFTLTRISQLFQKCQKVLVQSILTISGLPEPWPHQPRGEGAEREPGVGGDWGAPRPLQPAHPDDLHQRRWPDILRLEQCCRAGDFCLLLLFISCEQHEGAGDVPEDHNEHQDRGQLHILGVGSLHQRLQRQKDGEEKVCLSFLSAQPIRLT